MSQDQPLLLCLETATKTCSVCLARGREILAIRESHGEYRHAELLAVFADEVMKEAGITPAGLDAVVVSKGPGSYTGLRIGVSLAKGICFGAGLPLIGIDTTQAMADFAYNSMNEAEGYYVPVIDARRMEVYTSVFYKGERIRDTEAKIIDADSFAEFLEKGRVFLFGDGAAKLRDIITHANVVFSGDEFTSSKGLVGPGVKEFRENRFEDLSTFEPFYLKDFITQ